VVKFGPTISGGYTTDHSGRMQEWSAGLEFKIEGTGHSELRVGRTAKVERFEEQDFSKYTNEVELYSDKLSWLGFDVSYRQGTEINFDPAPGLDPFLAEGRELSATLALRPSPRLSLDQTWLYSGLRERPASVPPGNRPGSIFDNALMRWKLNYQFSRPLSLRAIVDYELVSPNPTLVDLERERRLGVDVLATYLLNPGTALYAGISDQRENLALDATSPPWLRRTDSPGLSTGRQFFFKASYLIRR